jgi:hypothetical protein
MVFFTAGHVRELTGHFFQEVAKYGPTVRASTTPFRGYVFTFLHPAKIKNIRGNVTQAPLSPVPFFLVVCCAVLQAVKVGCFVRLIHEYVVEATMCLGPSMLPTLNRHVLNDDRHHGAVCHVFVGAPTSFHSPTKTSPTYLCLQSGRRGSQRTLVCDDR